MKWAASLLATPSHELAVLRDSDLPFEQSSSLPSWAEQFDTDIVLIEHSHLSTSSHDKVHSTLR
jgi:hypothetical protein